MKVQMGDWLRRERESAGHPTAASFRRAISLGRGPIEDYERGIRVPTYKHVVATAGGLAANLADAVAGLWGEAAGDPCGCGCGGFKVLPDDEDPTLGVRARRQRADDAQALRVRRVCRGEGCTNVTTYLQTEAHTPLCRGCSLRGKSTIGRGVAIGDAHPFRVMLVACLAKNEITLAEACTRAGLSISSVQRWTHGKRAERALPWHEDVRSLGEVLGVPGLVDTIRSRWRRYRLTCRDPEHKRTVRRDKEVSPHIITAWRARGFHPELELDEATGTGFYHCDKCIKRAVGHMSSVGRDVAKLRKRRERKLLLKKTGTTKIIPSGKDELRERGKKLAASLTPEQRARAIRNASAARTAKAGTRTEEWTRMRSASNIKPRPKGTFVACLRCGDWDFFKPGGRRRGLMHGACQTAERRSQRTFGATPPPPASSARNVLDSGARADTFEMAVRCLLRHETVGGRVSMKPCEACGVGVAAPERLSPDARCHGLGLAHEFDLDPDTIDKRIHQMLSRWPPDGIASQQMRLWGTRLREAWNEQHPHRLIFPHRVQ